MIGLSSLTISRRMGSPLFNARAHYSLKGVMKHGFGLRIVYKSLNAELLTWSRASMIIDNIFPVRVKSTLFHAKYPDATTSTKSCRIKHRSFAFLLWSTVSWKAYHFPIAWLPGNLFAPSSSRTWPSNICDRTKRRLKLRPDSTHRLGRRKQEQAVDWEDSGGSKSKSSLLQDKSQESKSTPRIYLRPSLPLHTRLGG